MSSLAEYRKKLHILLHQDDAGENGPKMRPSSLKVAPEGRSKRVSFESRKQQERDSNNDKLLELLLTKEKTITLLNEKLQRISNDNQTLRDEVERLKQRLNEESTTRQKYTALQREFDEYKNSQKEDADADADAEAKARANSVQSSRRLPELTDTSSEFEHEYRSDLDDDSINISMNTRQLLNLNLHSLSTEGKCKPGVAHHPIQYVHETDDDLDLYL